MNLRIPLFAALGWVLYSCSSSDGGHWVPPVQPELPATGAYRVQQISHLGTTPNAYNWTLKYSDTHLTWAECELVGNASNSYKSALAYTASGVTITNTGGLNMTAVLNGDGNIEQLTVNKDEYYFTYADGRLIAWRKVMRDANFADKAASASAELNYQDGDLVSIVYAENNDDPIVVTLTPSTYPNTNGLLPAVLSRYMGCFGFEHLYYAGMLGKPTNHLVQGAFIDGLGDDDYEIAYNYSIANTGSTELCTFQYQGEAVAVDYEYK